MENTILKAKSKYLKDGEVIRLTAGKIAYQNPNRRNNEAEVEFGIRHLSGNKCGYWTITGSIHNHIHTDCVTCGASVHEQIQEFVKDPLLGELIEIGKKYHLVDETHLPKKVVKRTRELIAAFLDDYKRDHGE